MRFLHLCQVGYEPFLLRELEEISGNVGGRLGPGYLFSENCDDRVDGLGKLCFPQMTLIDPVEIPEGSVNAMAGGLLEALQTDFRELQIVEPWYFDVWVRRDQDGLSRRATTVRNAMAEKLKAKMGRVARLGTKEFPDLPGAHRGWGFFFEDYSRVFASSRLFFGGQRRMADDPAAPSRSYLKVEEAYKVMGRAPLEGERVVDLGAAPGGWSYSAARRGAKVDAVDNGPLKAGAADHPGIRHLREDGFRFGLGPGQPPYDWLFCDMVEDPFRVLRLLADWVEGRRCAKFVINLKFGRTDPVALLDEVRRFREGPLAEWPFFRVRHLFHDREEITLVGASASEQGML